MATLIAASLLAVTISAVGGAVPTSASTSTVAVPGTSYLPAVACASSTSCVAVGYNTSATEGVVVSINSGTPGAAQVVSAGLLLGVGCSSATTCYAVGIGSTTAGVVVPIASGVAGTAEPFTGAGLESINCPNATVCYAVGSTSAGEGAVVTVTSGVAGTAQAVSGTNTLLGVACSTSTICEAVGYNSSNQGVVVTLTSGTPGSAQLVSSGTALLEGVACPDTTTCEAVGYNPNGDDGGGYGYVLPITDGTPGSYQLSAGNEALFGIACPSVSGCLAGASNLNPQGFVVPVTGGAPGTAQAIPSTGGLGGIACSSSTTCYAVGLDNTLALGVVVTVNLPGAPGQPTGVAEPSAVSLSWTAPSSAGSSAISSYEVTPYIGGTAQTPIDTNSTATSYTVTGLTDGQAYTFTVAAVNGQGEGPASAASSAVTPTAPAPATYNALVPYRVCDTRAGNPSGLTGTDAQCEAKTLGPGQTLTIQVSGTNPSGTSTGGVPSSATSVVLNVTVTDTTAASDLAVWPAGGALPLSSSVNWAAGQTVPNLVTVGLSNSGQVSFYNDAGSVDVIVDVEGWMDSTGSSGGPYVPLTPYRVCDTRSGNPSGLAGLDLTQCESKTLPAHGTLTIQVSGTNPSGTSSGGVPAAAALSVDLTVTVTDTSTSSYLTVWPAGESQPTASNLNFVAGQTVANNVVVAVPQTGADAGKVNIYNDAGNADVIVDVSGYYNATLGGAGTFTPMVPYRICDTRPTSVSGLDDACTGLTIGAGGSGGTLTLQVAGGGGIPSGVTAVVLNVTVTDTTAADFLTVYPAGASRPLVSSMNWGPGETVASGVTATVGSGNEIDFYIPNGQADLVVDVVGWVGS